MHGPAQYKISNRTFRSAMARVNNKQPKGGLKSRAVAVTGM